MTSILTAALIIVIAVLVWAAGWRLLSPQNSAAGGIAALLLFFLHPAFVASLRNSSLWDTLFVMLFVTAWLCMENWSLFMRSWVLAGIYAFGFWVGSPFVLWGLAAMVPWVIFNRRPLPAIGSFLTVFLGGLFLFATTWGVAWFLIPNLGRPLFTAWIHWSGLKMPPAMSFAWLLLAIGAVSGRLQEMVQHRRSGASIFAAVLLTMTTFLDPGPLGLSVIALSAPLIASMLVKKEFLYHRSIRWLIGVTFILVLALAYPMGGDAVRASAAGIFIVWIGSKRVAATSRLPWRLIGEAVCVGAFLAESAGTLLHLF